MRKNTGVQVFVTLTLIAAVVFFLHISFFVLLFLDNIAFYMTKIKFLCFMLSILFGAFMFVYGEIDDSPGGQVLGLVVAIFGVVGVAKSKKKTSTQI